MTDIRPIPIDEPKIRISPTKAVIFTVISCGIVVLGVIAQNRPPTPPQGKGLQILGEETQTLDSYLPDDVKKTVSYAKSQQSKINGDSLLLAGKDLVASAASVLGEEVSKQTEQIASGAAKNVSDFVYKNTIEHIIDGLIYSLPEERQKQYNR